MDPPATILFTGCIYPGLRPFDVEDAVLFFGREEQTDELLRRLDDTHFLAVVGLSGSGKSSLVRAGLIPALRRGHLSGAGSRWRISVMRPGSDPSGALARVLDETLGKRDDRLATLRSGRLGLLDTSRQGRSADENLLLVVDQFEELFRFQDSNRGRAGEAAEFVELLLAASQDYEPSYSVYVVITLRSDYLGECARFRGLPEALNESQYLIPRMARERLREAIEGPAALGGLAVSKELEEELLDKTGDNPDQLPVLQHVLMRMWEIRELGSPRFRIGHDQYKAVGGWDDALNTHADVVCNSLGNRRDLAKRILQRLTEKAQRGREVRRPATVRELAEIAKVTADEVKQVAEHFRDPGCNFLTSPDRELTEDSVIDISHESLIRGWKQLNEWTTEESGWGEWYRRVEDRIAIGSAYLVDPELESSLQARDKGRWNEAWAERYRRKEDGVTPAYADVIRFLDESKKRRRDELARLRRTRVIVALTAVLFAALFLFATYFWLSARQQGNLAFARQLAADSSFLRSSNNNWTVAALLGIESLRRAETVQGYEAVWGVSSGMGRMGREVVRLMQDGTVMAVAFSPDGTLVATGSKDQTVVFEARTGREVARLTHEGWVMAVAFSPDGTLVATASGDKTARVFEAHTWREVARLAHAGGVNGVAFSPDGTLVATASDDKTARVFEARTGREVARLAHAGGVKGVAFSPDGTQVATASEDKSARVFEAHTGREVVRLAHGDVVKAVTFSPDGTLATASADKTARVFEAHTWREVARFAHAGGVNGVAFSPDGTLVATASEDETARVFESPGREVARLAHAGVVNGVAFSPDGTLVATGSMDRTARVFESRTGREVARLTHEGWVMAVAFSPDGTLVATASEDNTARVFEARTGPEVARLAHEGSVIAAAFSPDGTLVATASDDKTARVFEVRTGRELARLAHQGGVSAVAFSPDGTLVATASIDRTARVFEARTGREVGRLMHEGWVMAVAFSPDGTLVATASGDKTARVFEARTGREVARLTHEDGVNRVRFSPDGTLVATASDDKTARVFEARTGREVARLVHGDVVKAVAFSPDGTLLATASDDKTARVFEAQTGRQVTRLMHQNDVYYVAFSPDGTLVATASEDKTARVFGARTGREVARLAHEDGVIGVRFSPDGTLVATASKDKTARVFETRTGREVARLAFGEEVRDLAFRNRGRFLWAVTGTSYLHITQDPVHASDLIPDACSKLSRNLTREEWASYLGALAYRQTCELLNPPAPLDKN